MQDDPYLDVIDEQWANIVLVYQTFRGKDQIIQYDIGEQKIYSYPADEYIQNLSERTRDRTARAFADATKRKQFLLFIKDTKNQRLRSYVFDLPEYPIPVEMKSEETTVTITQTEIQALFNRFGAPLAPYALSSPERRGGAEVMVKALWTALIAGPEAETETWKVFQEQAHLADEDLQAVKDCYYQKMKPVVSEKQLAALRERYGVKKKDSIQVSAK